MYKDALFSLMIGSKVATTNNDLFWDFLVPNELNSYLWVSLKLAAYDHREESSKFMGTQLPNFYNKYTLEELHTDLLRELETRLAVEGNPEL